MPKLPGEIIGSIIDCLSSDKSTLCAWSLVARHWLPRSRHHLFRRLYLILALWNDQDNSAAFLPLLESPLVTFIPCVNEVVLQVINRYVWYPRTPGLSPSGLLCKLTDSGIRPTSLSIYNHLYEITGATIHGALPAFVASLVHLRLYYSGVVPLDELVTYICSFRSLESLALGCQTLGGIAEPTTTAPVLAALPPKLHTLDMAGGSPFLNWIASLSPAPRHISNLVVRESAWKVQKFLDSPVATGVRTLTFEDCDINLEILKTGRLTGLRSLSLEYRMNPPIRQHVLRSNGDPRFADKTNVIPVIEEFSSCTTVEMLKIAVHFLDFAVDEDVMSPWRAVDAAIVRAWPNVQRVVICRPKAENHVRISENTARKLRARMPLCKEQGILVIQNVT
ncbi:hypothetical protein B0H10DRAFT_2138151 [Mycena sp. CBHHK59/15]|nr:hypothetical protein B0H10DRAFT_2138151 [Mycena sp. CBHHK59/15]